MPAALVIGMMKLAAPLLVPILLAIFIALLIATAIVAISNL
jgi:hypothetical protein